MMKRFSTRADKWSYVFALISHIFNFLAESQILFLYHIVDHQKNHLFSNSFIQLSNQSSNHLLFLFVHSYHLSSFLFFQFTLFVLFFSPFSVLFFFFFFFQFSSIVWVSPFVVFRDLFDLQKIRKILFFFFFLFFLFFFFFFFRMFRVTKSAENVYDVFKNTNIRDNVRNESLRTFENDLISSKSDSNICSRARTTRLISKRFETHIIWAVKTMKLSVCTVWKRELNACSIFLPSRTNDVRSVLCSIEKWRIVRILMSLSLRWKKSFNRKRKRSNRWKK